MIPPSFPFMTIAALKRKFEALNTDVVSQQAVATTAEHIVTENKRQLYDGKLATGADIGPSYLNDPYFKSKESAQRYSNWKDKITPNPKRKKGIPNLYIDGTFYRSIEVKVDVKKIRYGSKTDLGRKIKNKFTGEIYGLGGEYKISYVQTHLKPEFLKGITAATGLKFK